ncbi:uncharacterized protein LOC114308656 [Camellia sinensis]|uniref:uncharacterized protein LOC114308656 n=1 Tax=Camellia sinensis TaxID=4442 RepID=UPI00103645D7|nr:uncharacterized protein LOC114308656 [Camellia sinensis]
MRGYHRDSKVPRCAMKVDIMKAYDNVRWEFILDILKAMDFPLCMINWIKACMTSPSFSICINGSLHGILAEKAKCPMFKFHWRCDKTKIVTSLFADDLMIFSKGDPETVNLIMQGLDEFRRLSGLTPSPNKSNIVIPCSVLC